MSQNVNMIVHISHLLVSLLMTVLTSAVIIFDVILKFFFVVGAIK